MQSSKSTKMGGEMVEMPPQVRNELASARAYELRAAARQYRLSEIARSRVDERAAVLVSRRSTRRWFGSWWKRAMGSRYRIPASRP